MAPLQNYTVQRKSADVGPVNKLQLLHVKDCAAWKFCKAGEMKHGVESKVFFQWPQTTKCL